MIHKIKKKKWSNCRIKGHSDSGKPRRKAFQKFKLKIYPCIQCKISLHKWISEYFRKLSNRLLLWYLRKVQRIYRWDNRRYTSANSQDKHGEQLNFMFFACKNSRNDSKVCCALIGQKNTKVFWHQSEARTAAAVWNFSGKTLSSGALHPVLYFSSRHFFPPV